MTTSDGRAQRAMRRALALAATPGVPLGPQPPRRLRAPRTGRHHRRRGLPPRRGHAARRGRRAGARRATPPGARPPWSPSSRATTPAAPGPAPRRWSPPGVRRVVFAQPDPQPGRRRGRRHACARPASRSSPGCSRDEARGRQPRLDLRRRARPPVRHLEVRHHPRRPQRRRRRHQPLGLQPCRPPRHPPAARALRRDARRHQHRRGRRPASSPSATRTTNPLAHQPLRAVMGLRDLAPRPPGLQRPRRDVRLRTRDPREALDDAVRARPPARLPRGRPHPRPRRSCAPGWSTRSSPTSPRCCWAPARSAVADLGITTIAEALRLHVADVHVLRATTARRPTSA